MMSAAGSVTRIGVSLPVSHAKSKSKREKTTTGCGGGAGDTSCCGRTRSMHTCSECERDSGGERRRRAEVRSTRLWEEPIRRGKGGGVSISRPYLSLAIGKRDITI